MANYQKIKGTRDFYGDKSIKLAFIENVTRDVAIKYGYGEIVTPIFENTDVFVKNVGEDIILVEISEEKCLKGCKDWKLSVKIKRNAIYEEAILWDVHIVIIQIQG